MTHSSFARPLVFVTKIGPLGVKASLAQRSGDFAPSWSTRDGGAAVAYPQRLLDCCFSAAERGRKRCVGVGKAGRWETARAADSSVAVRLASITGISAASDRYTTSPTPGRVCNPIFAPRERHLSCLSGTSLVAKVQADSFFPCDGHLTRKWPWYFIT